MASQIDDTKPATSADLLSSPIRTNFTYAKSEIEALQGAAGLPASVVERSSATTLAKATHQGKKIVATGAFTLTVDTNHGFDNWCGCELYAQSGAITVTASGTTVNVFTGKTAVVSSGGKAYLEKTGTTNTFVLTGELTAA